MALRIRLRRMGSTKRPFYRIVIAESKMPRDGRFVEIVGHYNPITDPAEIKVEEEKVYQWLRQGAQPTDTVKSLFKQTGLWRKWSLLKRGVDISQIKDEEPPVPVAAPDTADTEPSGEPVEVSVDAPVDEQPSDEKKESPADQ